MLDMDMKFKHGILTVRLKGVLDGDTIAVFTNDLNKIINSHGIKYVLLNLKKLEYIDNYGLEAIKNSYKRIKNNNGKLIICGIDKLLKSNQIIEENLYQVDEEVTAYEIINI